jgi:hypothetical protein
MSLSENLGWLDRFLPASVQTGPVSDRLKGRWFVTMVFVGGLVAVLNVGLGVLMRDSSLLAVGLVWSAACI